MWTQHAAPIDERTVALALSAQPGFAWLDSNRSESRDGRYSFLAAWPAEEIRVELGDPTPFAALRDLEGSTARVGTEGPEASPTIRVDPASTRIIYSRLAGQAPVQTLIRDLDTAADRAFYATLEYPRWSRDGRDVLGSMYTNQRFPGDIAICAVEFESCRTIAENARIPVWSADETRVFFVRGFGTSQELFVVNADGTGKESKVMDMAPLFQLGPFYSVADDNSIFWIRHERDRGVVWFLDR